MKLYTSYFYNIRFFNNTMIPLSTAVYDPKWFHDNKGDNHRYYDKNGVLIGLRIPIMNPKSCHADGCPCELLKSNDNPKCKFLTEYREGLDKINFQKLINSLENLVVNYKLTHKLEQEISVVFIVHESPDNPCSERIAIQDYFKSHGIEITEWMP